MPYTSRPANDPEIKSGQRKVLISGAPHSGKTTSLATWDPPIHIVTVPGEYGSDSIARTDRIVRHDFELATGAKTTAADWRATVTLCQDIGAGKHGPVQTLAIDGVHKFYTLGLDAVSNGAFTSVSGEYDGRKVYPRGWNLFANEFLAKIFALPIPNVVMTSWTGLDKDDPDDKSETAPKSLYPALPGSAGQNVLGEFGILLMALVEGTGGARKYVWATQTQGKIRGAGIRGDVSLTSKIPPKVPQDWQALKKWLDV